MFPPAESICKCISNIFSIWRRHSGHSHSRCCGCSTACSSEHSEKHVFGCGQTHASRCSQKHLSGHGQRGASDCSVSSMMAGWPEECFENIFLHSFSTCRSHLGQEGAPGLSQSTMLRMYSRICFQNIFGQTFPAGFSPQRESLLSLRPEASWACLAK